MAKDWLDDLVIDITENPPTCKRAYVLKDESEYKTEGDKLVAYLGTDIAIMTPSTVKEIGAHAFENNPYLKAVVIPGTVEKIGDYAFAGCPNLECVVIADGVKSVGMGAFCGCGKLRSVEARGRALLSIGEEAFRKCEKLKKVYLPSVLETIGALAFAECSGLERIVLPPNVRNIGDRAFFYCYQLTVLYDISLTTWVYAVKKGKRWACGTKKVRAFKIKDMSYLDTPNSKVISEEEYEYFGTYCGGEGDCILALSDKTTSIDFDPEQRRLFDYIVVQEGNPAYFSVGGVLIEKETNTLVAGSNRGAIPQGAGIRVIADHAFASGRNEEIVVPEGIERIGDFAFFKSDLRTISLPESLTSIGVGAFAECPDLSAIVLPAAVTDVGLGAFHRCRSLSVFAVEAGNPAFYSRSNCIFDAETDILLAGCKASVIPQDGSVKMIAEKAFIETDLKELTIPSSVRRIEKRAFLGARKLSVITIEEGVSYIGFQAFFCCDNLTDIIYTGTVDSWKEIEKSEKWKSVLNPITVHCTDGTVEEHRLD